MQDHTQKSAVLPHISNEQKYQKWGKKAIYNTNNTWNTYEYILWKEYKIFTLKKT